MTAALWLAFFYPVEALARFAVPEAAVRIAWPLPTSTWLADAFLSDLAAAARVAGFLVCGLLTWGSYVRWRGGGHGRRGT